MTNYNDFLEKTPYPVLSYETAMEVFDKLMSSLPEDEDSRELLEDLINSIYTYAETRAHWYLMSKEEKLETDKSRTMYHDSVITNLNMIKRYLISLGKDIGFFDLLDDENAATARKKKGDFACVIYGMLGVMSR